MLRKISFVLFLALLSGPTAFGQEWARKMFEQTSHNFGDVARNGKAEFEFVISNIYLGDVHIASVRTSCGCTSPRIKQASLKTYEKSAIVAKFNTHLFLGRKGATVTVVFDKPAHAEVQLHVKGNIRGDVVFSPGSVQLGSVDQGTPAAAKVSLSHTGSNNWRILEVKSGNPHIVARAVETGRGGGRVSYDLLVRLDRNAPAAYLRDHLVLITNDGRSKKLALRVEGRVRPAIMVSPSSLFMGVLQPGKQVTRQLVVRGKKAFRIVSIKCDDDSLKLLSPVADTRKTLHVIPVTFIAGARTGKLSQTIRIETDLEEAPAELLAYAVVTAP